MKNSVLDHVLSPAKLNLFLHVVGQRPDGYHLLQSVFVAIDWYDTLHFERRTDGKIIRHDLSVKLPAQDLITRAAHLLQQTTGTTYGADISIQKNIPMQAGLGGGSSNAATTLLALNQLWGLNLNHETFFTLAQKLGSDVPFFLHNGPAWVEGIGEKLTPIQLPPQAFKTPVALLKPQGGVSTQQIFSSPLLTKNTTPATIMDFPTSQNLKAASVFEFGKNDLQQAAIAYEPQIAQAITCLENICSGQVRMTGSGTAVFGAIKKNIDILDLSANFLETGWQLKMCKILDLHPHVQWLPIDTNEDKN